MYHLPYLSVVFVSLLLGLCERMCVRVCVLTLTLVFQLLYIAYVYGKVNHIPYPVEDQSK